MKKFFKMLTALASLAALAFGAYCVYKKITESEGDTDDEFEDLFEEEYADDGKASREYVSINLSDEDANMETQD